MGRPWRCPLGHYLPTVIHDDDGQVEVRVGIPNENEDDDDLMIGVQLNRDGIVISVVEADGVVGDLCWTYDELANLVMHQDGTP